MTLRDAVRTATNQISPAARALAQISSTTSLPLPERLRAFRTLTEREVGNTWMRRSRALERDFGLEEVYLKFEGDNPTGTQKDRIAFAQLADALEQGYTDVILASCGNYGVAMALAAKLAGLRCHVYIPAGYHTERLGEMTDLDAIVHRPAGTYEEVVGLSSERAAVTGWYDANPGGANTELQLDAYAAIGREVLDQLGRAPAACAVPVSNGTLLAGIHRGFGDVKVPVLAASSVAKNPIVYSFRKGLDRCVDLDPARIRETITNEPLINWHSFDGQEALDAVRDSGGSAHNVSDEKMRQLSTYLSRREALRVLPASTASLAALLERPDTAGPLVAILTAKR